MLQIDAAEPAVSSYLICASYITHSKYPLEPQKGLMQLFCIGYAVWLYACKQTLMYTTGGVPF